MKHKKRLLTSKRKFDIVRPLLRHDTAVRHKKGDCKMSLVIENLYYSDEHEWVKVDDKNNAVIGITDYAQDSLGDIVFVELPQVGEDFAQMDQVGVLESVKTVSNIYLPVSGRITEINDAVVDNPSLINSSPYDEGWLIKMEIYEPAELEDLKSSEDYEELTKDEA